MLKKEKFLIYTFHFLLVTFFFQTRYAFFARAQLVDYLIPFVYLTDILILALLIQTALFHRNEVISWFKSRNLVIRYSLFVICYLVVSGVSNFSALYPLGAWYKWLKTLEFTLFAFWLTWFLTRYKAQGTRHKVQGTKLLLVTCYLLLNFGLLFECLIAWGEWLTQRSLGLQVLGEWRFSVLTPGIAKVILSGKQYLRPYATFPHPNVLGGILAIMAPVNLLLLLQQVKAQGTRHKAQLLLVTCYLLLVTSALFITFSRSAWLSYAILVAVVILRWGPKFKRHINLKIFVLALLVLLPVTCYLLPVIHQRLRTLSTTDQLSLKQRLELNSAALAMIRDHPLFGVGCNNFIPNLEKYQTVSGFGRWLQPVHNIPLLIIAENGLIGASFFLIFIIVLLYHSFRLPTTDCSLREISSKCRLPITVAWLGILITSFFDHYWWTLQQGQLMLWLTIGLTMAASNSNHPVA